MEGESEDEVFSDITTVSEDIAFETHTASSENDETDTDCTLMVRINDTIHSMMFYNWLHVQYSTSGGINSASIDGISVTSSHIAIA